MSNINLNELFSGTFIQLDHWSDDEGARFQKDIRSLSEEHWCQMVQDMFDIGMDTLVLQQSIDCRAGWDNPQTYYNSKKYKKLDWIKGNTFDAIVDTADKLGMTIFFGIGTMYTKDPYYETDTVLEQAKAVASELLELYADRPSFGGWYWTYEYPPGSISGRDSMQKIVPEIRKLHDCAFMLAPNSDRMMTPTLLQDIDVDICAYQDNVGLGICPDPLGRSFRTDRCASLQALPLVYEKLKFAHDGWKASDQKIPLKLWNTYFRERGRTALWNDIEVWEFDHNGALIPAEFARVVVQLKYTAPYVEKQIIYQYPGLMLHPDFPVKVGGERAETFYMQYHNYREEVLKKKR